MQGGTVYEYMQLTVSPDVLIPGAKPNLPDCIASGEKDGWKYLGSIGPYMWNTSALAVSAGVQPKAGLSLLFRRWRRSAPRAP